MVRIGFKKAAARAIAYAIDRLRAARGMRRLRYRNKGQDRWMRDRTACGN